jgi:hypothetical protein
MRVVESGEYQNRHDHPLTQQLMDMTFHLVHWHLAIACNDERRGRREMEPYIADTEAIVRILVTSYYRDGGNQTDAILTLYNTMRISQPMMSSIPPARDEL